MFNDFLHTLSRGQLVQICNDEVSSLHRIKLMLKYKYGGLPKIKRLKRAKEAKFRQQIRASGDFYLFKESEKKQARVHQAVKVDIHALVNRIRLNRPSTTELVGGIKEKASNGYFISPKIREQLEFQIRATMDESSYCSYVRVVFNAESDPIQVREDQIKKGHEQKRLQFYSSLGLVLDRGDGIRNIFSGGGTSWIECCYPVTDPVIFNKLIFTPDKRVFLYKDGIDSGELVVGGDLIGLSGPLSDPGFNIHFTSSTGKSHFYVDCDGTNREICTIILRFFGVPNKIDKLSYTCRCLPLNNDDPSSSESDEWE